MELNAIFMNRIAVKAEGGGYTAKTSASEQSFGSFMDKAVTGNARNFQSQSNVRNKRQANAGTVSESVDRGEAGVKSDDSGRMEKSDTETVGEANTTTEKKADMAEKEPKESKEQPKDEDQLNEEIAVKLSEALQIPVEVIQQILAQMNMTAVELTDSGKLQDFMENLLAVDDTVSLPDIPVLEIVQEVLSQEVLPQLESENPVEEMTVDLQDNHVETDAKKIDLTSAKPITDKPAAAEPMEDDVMAEPVIVEQDGVDLYQPKADTAEQESDTRDDGLKQAEAPTVWKDDVKVPLQEETEQDIFPNMLTTGVDEVRHIQSTAVKAEALKNINTQDVVNQIVDKMKVEVKGNVSEVRLTLRPEHLGDVSLKISVENGIVTASFVAENERVKEVIESNFNQLKDTLAAQGLQVSQLSVSVGQNDQQRRMGEFARGQQGASRIARISNAAAMAVASAEEEVYSNPYDILENSVDFTA